MKAQHDPSASRASESAGQDGRGEICPQANATEIGVSTVPAMTTSGSIDQRTLEPRDYLATPAGFGQPRANQSVLPPGGDAISQQVAWVQHQLMAKWRRRGRWPSGASMGRRYGFSRDTWSRASRGERWMGETIQCAIVEVLAGF